MPSSNSVATTAELELACHLAPVIRFSDNEPFLPSRVGITVFTEPGASPSSSHTITLGAGIAKVIEYAVWWDWDIQHLYELEHIWLHLDAENNVIAVEASAHGGVFPMTVFNGALPLEDGRVTLFSAPGKHAFTATAEGQLPAAQKTALACQELAGNGSILVNEIFEQALGGLTAEDHRAVTRYLQSRAFLPAFTFNQRFDLSTVEFSSWPDLVDWIPERLRTVLAEVRASQPLP